MKKAISLLIILFLSVQLFSQTGAYLVEKSQGYKGGYIPEIKLPDNSLNFLVMGDFGRVGEYYQKEVARGLGNAAVSLEADFIVSVGDNFYPNGVQSMQDYHWISSFESIYTHPSLYADWYVALGNHDYHGNYQAQIDYSDVSRRWNMPGKYYTKTFNINKKDKLLLVVIDTNPFIDSYYEKPIMIDNVVKQDTLAQRKWIESVLDTKDSSIKWKVVVGHHPMYSGGKRIDSEDTKLFENKFAPLFDKYKVDAYICGHEHDLQIIRPEGRYTTQFLSGSASEVRKSGHREGTLFAEAIPGFLAFSVTSDKILVQVVKSDDAGDSVVYEMELKK